MPSREAWTSAETEHSRDSLDKLRQTHHTSCTNVRVLAGHQSNASVHCPTSIRKVSSLSIDAAVHSQYLYCRERLDNMKHGQYISATDHDPIIYHVPIGSSSPGEGRCYTNGAQAQQKEDFGIYIMNEEEQKIRRTFLYSFHGLSTYPRADEWKRQHRCFEIYPCRTTLLTSALKTRSETNTFSPMICLWMSLPLNKKMQLLPSQP